MKSDKDVTKIKRVTIFLRQCRTIIQKTIMDTW